MQFFSKRIECFGLLCGTRDGRQEDDDSSNEGSGMWAVGANMCGILEKMMTHENDRSIPFVDNVRSRSISTLFLLWIRDPSVWISSCMFYSIPWNCRMISHGSTLFSMSRSCVERILQPSLFSTQFWKISESSFHFVNVRLVY